MKGGASENAELRADAARILARLLNQQGSLATLLDGPQPPMLRELCFGSCRWYHRLSACLEPLLDKPLKKKDRDVHCLLLLGLYQLEYLRVPDHAAVNETVAATAALKKHWARRLVNAVLRAYQRRREELLAVADRQDSSRYAHPAWLVQALRAAWPRHWEAILEANNQRAPMTLRGNSRRITRDDLLAGLDSAGLAARPGALCETAVYLEEASDVTAVPGFTEGRVSVQDEASQLVPSLLSLRPGQRVLDACAAPGGKTAHLLEYEAELELLALDTEDRRLARVRQNLDRLGLEATLRAADATQTGQWWDGNGFDRILLDAPCSATGIIRRQPDIKLLRGAGDVERMAALQQQLLEALWSCLEPGGVLLYTTCSLLPRENDEQITRFLERHPDAGELNIDAEWGEACRHGRQLLPAPGGQGPDGFYFARLARSA